MAENFEDDFAVRMGLLPPQDSTGFLDRRGAFKARERDDLHPALSLF
jgi:hypothetical protein